MNNVQSTIAAIHSMNKDQLDQVVEAIKLQRTFLARSTARSLSVGDSVKFTGRQGQVVRGVVDKVNRKTVMVRSGAQMWRVTASLLEAAQRVVDAAACIGVLLREQKEHTNKKNLTERTSEVILYVQLSNRGHTMQNVHILQLQGAGDDENALTVAAVFADYDEAVAHIATINAEYEVDFAVYTLDENAYIETHTVVDNMWGL